MPRLLKYWTEPPTRVRVYPCPQCQETISIDARNCRFCHVPVDVDAAEKLWAKNYLITNAVATAVSRANAFSVSARISITIAAVWIIFAVGNLTETWAVCHLLAISYGAQWLNHNRSLVTDDADYVEAVVKVKNAMQLWAVALVLQVGVYLFVNGLPNWHSTLDMLGLE